MTSKTYGEGWILATILTATFIGQFDFFVVNVAAPDIQEELNAGNTQLELVLAGYAFMYAAGLVTGGRLGDIYGRRRIFSLGLIAFAVTSALCGIAPGANALVAFRALQGLAAAILLPQVLAFINTLLPPQHRGRAMGWFGVASGIGAISGQGLGGLLVDANLWDLGWRLIFLVNVPIMALALIATLKVVPHSEPQARIGLDITGAFVLFAGMAGLMAAIILAQHDLPIIAIAAGLGGLIVLALAVWHQSHRVRVGKDVMMDPALFKISSMRWGIIASTAFMGYFGSFMFILTIILQQHSQLSPMTAGLVFVPSGLTFMASSLFGSGWIRNHMRSGLLSGCAITAVGLTVVLVAALTDVPANQLPWWLVIAVSLTGIGNGLVLPTLIGISLSEVQPVQAGMASGVVTTLQQFGASFGVAVVGALFYAAAETSFPRGLMTSTIVHLVLIVIVALSCLVATSASHTTTQQRSSGAPRADRAHAG